jgi:hypothetical protein
MVNNYKNFLLDSNSEDIEFMMTQLNDYFTIGFEFFLESREFRPNITKIFKDSFENFYFKYENMIIVHENDKLLKITNIIFEKIDKSLIYLKDFFKNYESQPYLKFSNNLSYRIKLGIKNERRRISVNGLYTSLNIVKGVMMISDQGKKWNSIKGTENKLIDYFSFIKSKLIEKLKKEQNNELYLSIEEMEKYLYLKIKELFNFFTPKLFGIVLKNSRQEDYVEFNYFKYQNMTLDELKDKLMYFCYIVYLMSSEYRKKEYHKKLFVFRKKVR